MGPALSSSEHMMIFLRLIRTDFVNSAKVNMVFIPVIDNQMLQPIRHQGISAIDGFR